MRTPAFALLATFVAQSGLVAQGTPAPAVRRDTVAATQISLDEALRLARRNSPQIIQAQGTERVNAAALRTARYSLFPTVSLSFGATRTGSAGTTRINANGETITTAANPWTFNNGLTLNAQLFDAGRRLFNRSAAQASLTAAEATSVSQEFAAALGVQEQYFAALAARESEDAARAQLALAQQQLRASVTKVRLGAATRSDSLRSAIQVNNAELALLTAQTNLQNANATLTRLIGAPATVTPVRSDTAAIPVAPVAALPDSATLRSMALEGPAVRQATAQLEAAHASRRATRSAYFPTINGSFSFSGSGTDFYTGAQYNYNNRLSLSLSYPLWDGYQRDESRIRAEVSEQNAEVALRDARLAAEQQLQQYLGALRTALQRVDLQSSSVVAAQEDLRVQQRRYEVGASTLVDVLTSQSTLTQAQSALIQARLDARIARARVEALIGRSLDTVR